MTAPHHLSGMTFGRLTALKRVERGSAYTEWLCKCVCGNEAEIKGYLLVRGHTQSCGCLRKEKIRELGLASRTHGHGQRGGTPTYRSWRAMIDRCTKPDVKDWPDYGGRGITVHEPWRLSFSTFLADMGEQSKGMTLDRRNNDGPYDPANCRWATRGRQANNRRSNINLTFNGQTQTVAEWCKLFEIDPHLAYKRLSRGWSPERALKEAAKSTKLG